MTRTKLCDRLLPDYTVGEEIFNYVSHIVGASFGLVAATLCIVQAALNHNTWGIVGSEIYGFTLVLLYTTSSIYHALAPSTAKKVMQVIDHCVIYFLIAGTYTPILFCSIRLVSPAWCWILFGLVWGLAAMATVFTAIDLKKYNVLSMICYIGMGWCIVIAIRPAMEAIPRAGLMWILAGGISYTLGAILYGLGVKHRYMHSVFHVFVVLGSVMQFFGIIFYVL